MRFHYRCKQTIVTILVDDERYYNIAVKAILEAREQIEFHIREDPFFLTSLEPYKSYSNEITKRMTKASVAANVGPMAAVAGTIAQYSVERMVENGASYAIVDNGGDIAAYTDRETILGIYGGSETDINIGFMLKPARRIQALCTSSGKIGHSISFGEANVASVYGFDASMADAFATALGNEIKEGQSKEEFTQVTRNFWEKAKKFNEGIFAIKGEMIGFAGNIPELRKTKVDPELITRG